MPDEDLLPIDAQAEFGPTVVFPVMEEMPEEPDPYADVKSDLDPRARQDFTGLLYLGCLEEECTVGGHKFLLRTPSQDDRLEMGVIHKPYLNTVSTEVAWRAITVAAHLRRIDSEIAPEPLNPAVSGVRTRFEWMRSSIYSDEVIDRIYQYCLELSSRVGLVIDQLDGLGER